MEASEGIPGSKSQTVKSLRSEIITLPLYLQDIP